MSSRMDSSSWFDVGVVDDVVSGVGFPSRRRDRHLIESRTRWTSVATSATSVSHRSFLEETRCLDQDLEATSARIREATRFSTDDSMIASRRLHFAQRFNDLLRRNSIVEDVVTSDKSSLQDEINQQRGRLKCLEDKYKEHIAVLEFQVKAHKDDWEAERSEKQQVLKDKIAIEAKVRQLQRDVRCLKIKLKEERVENASHHCECCGLKACRPDADTVTPSMIPRDNKTYRTSVHLPCTALTASLLKPKATALCVYEDVLIDVKENASNTNACGSSRSTLKTQKLPPDGFLRSASISDEDSLLCVTDITQRPTESKPDADLSCRRLRKRNGLSNHTCFDSNEKSKNEYQFVAMERAGNDSKIIVSQSASQPNLTTPSPPLSCSVLHITPCLSIPAESELNNGVTIGYTSNGLASVCSFPQVPIVKSYSLPTARVADKITSFECEFPVSESSSLGSSWSALGQPAQIHVSSVDSVAEEKKSGKLSILGAFAKSMKLSKECVTENKDHLFEKELDEQAARKNTSIWNAKYFENGVATQTGGDLMCPTCSQIFPLIEHVKFLDHFEKCGT